jgi:Ferredoxin-like domain in Api92-like protein
MANYVQNTLRVVNGDPKEVFDVIRSERTIFDFRKLVPVPDEIANSNEEVERHGVMVPLSKAWTAENWGTTRNACFAKYSEDNGIDFDTAWNAPEPILEALAKRFPNREIVVTSDYICCGADEFETYVLKNGLVTSEGRQQY